MTRRLAVSKAITIALVVSLAVLAVGQRGEASPYKVTVLGDQTRIHALNDEGMLAGTLPYSVERLGGFGFYYDSNPGGVVTVSGLTPPSDSGPGSHDARHVVSGLNNQGQGVGYDMDTREPLLFDARTGAATPLPFSPDRMQGLLRITDSGAIYGTRTFGDPQDPSPWYFPFVYRDGAMQDLAKPPRMAGAELIAAEDSGRFLFLGSRYADSLQSYTHPFLYDNGKWTELVGDYYVNPYDGRPMNALGDVVLSTHFVGGQSPHAVLIPNGGDAVKLGELPGHFESMATAINDDGWIVGWSGDPALREYRGFLYRDGVMTDLNDLVELADGWLISGARLINERGQILATMKGPDGRSALEVLLTPGDQPTPPDFILPEMPVPEPSTWLVFALAAVGLGCREARKRGRNRAD